MDLLLATYTRSSCAYTPTPTNPYLNPYPPWLAEPNPNQAAKAYASSKNAAPSAYPHPYLTPIPTMTTPNPDQVAMEFCASKNALILRLNTASFMERGADISFLSAFPTEKEVCPVCVQQRVLL